MISCMYIQPYNIISLLFGGIMKFIKCKICDFKFIANSISDVCSLKCRLIQGSEKLDNGCWQWIRSRGGDYGKVRWLQKTISSHRASYIAFKGEVSKGLNVCHTCDNPLCVNPDHLWLGTQKQNKQDSKKKGRTLIGQKNHFSKFTDVQIEEMRKLKNEGFTYDRLKRIFNCSTAHIFNVIKQKVRS